MQAIAEFIVKVADLVEAEGRSARSVLREEARDLRQAAGNFAMGLVLVVAGALLVVVGLLAWLGAVYLALSETAGPAWGALGAGVVGVGCGAGCLWVFRKMVSARPK